MTDYGALADKLKGLGKAGNESSAKLGTDPAAYYASVSTQIASEVEKANQELDKRGLPLIERVFIPSYHGKLTLTFGIALLCNVELEKAKGRITAIILGPPNRLEIARKEFVIQASEKERLAASIDKTHKVAIGLSPEKVAAEIVSGLLVGEFE